MYIKWHFHIRDARYMRAAVCLRLALKQDISWIFGIFWPLPVTGIPQVDAAGLRMIAIHQLIDLTNVQIVVGQPIG